MKFKHIIFCAMALLTACTDGKGPDPEIISKNEGVISFRSMNIGVDTDAVSEPRSIDATVDVSAYNVELINTDGEPTTAGAWKYSQMPEMQVLPIGNYMVRVTSCSVKPAAFEEPLYQGIEQFTIESGEVHNVGQVVCKLANVKVSVHYSDRLLELMDGSSAVTVEAGNGSLSFGATETRAGYFQYLEGSTTLIATFNGTVGGRTETLRKVLTDVLPGHHYILNYTVRSGGFIDPKGIAIDGNITDATIGFVINTDEDPLDDSDRPGGDDNQQTPGDDKDLITFTSPMLSFTDANSTKVADASVLIHAEHGISSLTVDIISDDLNDEMLHDVGLASHFDLAAPGELADALEGLGFPVGADVKGQKNLTFDITQFMPLLEIYPGTHAFRITVTDSEGNTESRTLTFIAE
ncbi:MAG: DUF4493 domain-containing protein [Muribaculaceae bacterium]|nr:DUF4493 domain-containing protein [Muribaculaceae bacterium]